MLEKLKRDKKIVLAEIAQKRYGNADGASIKKMYNLFYFNKNKWQEEMGERLAAVNGVISIVTADTPQRAPRTYAPRVHKDKTAVLIIKEKTTEGTVSYEVETLGDVNRNMMKEALKQLMEAFI